jgi:hypothetical protein
MSYHVLGGTEAHSCPAKHGCLLRDAGAPMVSFSPFRVAVGVVASCLVACTGGADEELPLRFETAHFRYHADPDRRLCPQLGEWLETHFDAHANWLALTTSDAIDYYLLSNQAEVRTRCGEAHGATPSGCVLGRSVYTWREFHAHEIVHAYTLRLERLPPLFFNEGLAVMLGGGPGGEVNRTADVEALMVTPTFHALVGSDASEGYLAAGSFARFVVDRHGRLAYLDFFGSLPTSASAELIRQTFDRIFGESLEAAIVAWRGEPVQTEGDFRLHLAECSSPPLSAAVDRLPCDAMSSLYAYSTIRSFSLTERSGVRLALESDVEAVAAIRTCTGRLQPQRELHSFLPRHRAGRRELWTDLSAGDYWLHITAAGDGGQSAESSATTAVVHRGSPLLSESCEDGGVAHAVPAETAEVVFAGDFDQEHGGSAVEASRSVRFVVQAVRVAETTSYPPAGIDRVTLCSGPCSDRVFGSCARQITGTLLNPHATYRAKLSGAPGTHGFRWGLQLHQER